jgi:gamma-glutamyltranspeptidase/glutathione hydrolase
MTSMMAPTALRWPDGREVATGSGGSNRIRSAVLQVIVNLVDHGMELDQAVRAPRIHVEGPLLSVEGGHDADALAAWPAHQVWDDRSVFFGGAHTVEHRGDVLGGAGDPRRDGASLTV